MSEFLGVDSVTWRRRDVSRPLVCPWPFAACSLDRDRVALGARVAMVGIYRTFWKCDLRQLDRVLVDGDRMLLPEDEHSFGMIKASPTCVQNLADSLQQAGVDVLRQKIPLSSLRRNQDARDET